MCKTINATAAALAIFLAAASFAQSETQVDFKIDAPKLSRALIQLTEQSGMQLIYPAGDKVIDLPARPLAGKYTAEAALKQLLKGTGLEYEFIDAKTISIVDPTAKASLVIQNTSTLRLAQNTSAATSTQSSKEYPAKDDDSKVQEVVVTAQRREERLKDVPIAISVLTGEHLDASRTGGVLEELRRVPAVATIPQPEGRSNIVIRGVAPQVGTAPVGFYFDMAPVSFLNSALAPDANVYDLQRVEVLKGPQGTGYGIGSSSGVVRVLTNDPNPSKFEAKGRVSFSSTQGGKTNYLTDAAVNAPIIEGRLAIRGVVGFENFGGWIDRPNKKDFNDGDATNIRLKIGGELVDGLNTVVGVWHSKRRLGQPAADDNGNRNVLYDEQANAVTDLYSFVLRKDFGAFSLVSSTSYLDLYSDNLKSSIFNTLRNLLNNFGRARSLSEEINLTSNGAGPWKWTAGVFYRSAEQRDKGRAVSPIGTIQTAPFTADQTWGADSYAAFGELGYSLSQFELSAGLRYTQEKLDTFSNMPGVNYADEGTFSKVTPRLALSWKPNPDVTSYLSYAEGFRSGFLQTQAAFTQGFVRPAKSDLLRNYELGSKATVFGGMLSWEVAAYYMDWRDVQQSLTFPNAGSFSTGYLNAGSASGLGGEVSVTLRPVERFQIGGAYSQNDLTFDADVISGGNVLFRKGDRLAISPKTTYGAFADYTAPIGANLEFQVGANLSHVSSQIQRFLLGAVTDIHNDSITVAGLNIGVGRQDGSWRTSLFVDNLTDEDGAFNNNYGAATPPIGNIDEGLRPRPRTVGVQIEMKL